MRSNKIMQPAPVNKARVMQERILTCGAHVVFIYWHHPPIYWLITKIGVQEQMSVHSTLFFAQQPKSYLTTQTVTVNINKTTGAGMVPLEVKGNCSPSQHVILFDIAAL